MSSLDTNSAKVWTLTGTEFTPDSAARAPPSLETYELQNPHANQIQHIITSQVWGQVEVCSMSDSTATRVRIYKLVHGHKQWAAHASVSWMALYWSAKSEPVQGVGWRRRRGGDTRTGSLVEPVRRDWLVELEGQDVGLACVRHDWHWELHAVSY